MHLASTCKLLSTEEAMNIILKKQNFLPSLSLFFTFIALVDPSLSRASSCLNYYSAFTSPMEKTSNDTFSFTEFQKIISNNENQSPLTLTNHFINQHLKSTNEKYKEILEKISSQGSENELKSMLNVISTTTLTTQNKIEKAQALLQTPKTSNEKLDQLGNELKACYNNLTSCRATANQVILNTSDLLNEVTLFLKQIDSKVSQIENLISNLEQSHLTLKPDSYFFDSEIILSQFKTALASLNSYKQITNSYIEATVLNHRTLVVQSNTLPVFEEAIMLLEAKGLKVGIYRDYLHKLTAMEPLKTTSSELKNSDLGLQILALVKKQGKPGYEAGLKKSILELVLQQSIRKITVKDALDIHELTKTTDFYFDLGFSSTLLEFPFPNLRIEFHLYNSSEKSMIKEKYSASDSPYSGNTLLSETFKRSALPILSFIKPFIELLPIIDFNLNRENNPLYDLYFEQIQLKLDKEISRLTELRPQKKWYTKILLTKSTETQIIDYQVTLLKHMKDFFRDFKTVYLNQYLLHSLD